MRRNAGWAVAAVFSVAVGGTALAQEVQTPERAIPDQYIVVFDDARVAAGQARGMAEALARANNGRVMHVYEHALRGF